MKTEIEKKDGKVEAKVTLPFEEFKKYEKETLKDFQKNLELPGFRKGAVPEEVVRKKAGKEQILTEAAKRAIEGSYQKIVEEENFEPISRPEVEILKLAENNPFEFKATFDILPQFDLPDYGKIAESVKKEKLDVEEKEVEDTLKWLQKSRPDLREILRPAEKGNFVEINFSCPDIEKGKKHEDAFVLGEGRLVPGFSEELVGMEPGEKKSFSIDLPDDFRVKKLAGEKVDFEVEMKKVKEKKEREIDDDFAKEVGDFETLSELKENIRRGLGEEKEKALKQKRQEKILDKVVKKSDFKVPEVLVERETEKKLNTLKQRVAREMNTEFENYLEKLEKTEEELSEKLRKEAKKEAERFLVLRKVAEEEGIKVSEEEVQKEIENLLSRYPDPERAREAIDEKEIRRYTKQRIKNQKTLDKLLSY